MIIVTVLQFMMMQNFITRAFLLMFVGVVFYSLVRRILK